MMELYLEIKAIVFFTFIAIAILAISTYLIKVLITWIYMKMCRARKRRIEWLMKRQEERDREKCDQQGQQAYKEGTHGDMGRK